MFGLTFERSITQQHSVHPAVRLGMDLMKTVGVEP